MPPRSKSNYPTSLMVAGGRNDEMNEEDMMYTENFSIESAGDESFILPPPNNAFGGVGKKKKSWKRFFSSRFNVKKPSPNTSDEDESIVSATLNYTKWNKAVPETNNSSDDDGVDESSSENDETDDESFGHEHDIVSDPDPDAVDAIEILGSLSYLEIDQERKQLGRRSFARQVGMKFDFDKDSVLLYRTIDARQFDLAMRLLVETPEEASHWVFRSDIRNCKLMWIFLPLHCAIFCGAPLSLIKQLVKANPDSVEAKTLEGKLPLHIACETGADFAIVMFLFEQYPAAKFVEDDYNNTPLRLAMQSYDVPGRTRTRVLTALRFP